MSAKSHTRKHTQSAMSPLLRALTFSRAAHEPVTRAMLLQCYTGLDAFRRGHGSRELFTTLGRQLLVAGELCHLGYESSDRMAIEEAHAAMMQIDTVARESGIWAMSDIDYAWLCFALDVFARQLAAASLEDIAMAETKMIKGLLTAGRIPAPADASS
ncbi:hypothetical protein [Paraburkholderia sartisoli]|uniref:Uncharacterized protein n=1 Tax=Paraburkholderia sartisoli TaxID=83784 RepID=A0A1H4FB72_9BURK|nr:hypothetical protein [Paraburkholderia sartisoli]SEA94028.1 hypothetical protein SAMN05192564_104209 [Paraburkholderia sartisoli]